MPPLAELDINRVLAKSSELTKATRAATTNLNGKRPLEIDNDVSASDDEDTPVCFKWDCNQIRTKINRLIRSGEMKVTEFQRNLSINSNSYGRFMKLKGPVSGCDNQTYEAATRYFLKREAKGVKLPNAKKAKAGDLAKFDVSELILDGEETEDVTIYDTCDDLRKKIQAHLRNPGVTQAALCREIGNMYNPPRPCQSKQLADFLKKKGATSGNTSVVYYGSYVYFEKLRLKNRAKKSKKRLEVEVMVPEGMTRDARYNQHYIVSTGTSVVEDQFGQIRTIGRYNPSVSD